MGNVFTLFFAAFGCVSCSQTAKPFRESKDAYFSVNKHLCGEMLSKLVRMDLNTNNFY